MRGYVGAGAFTDDPLETFGGAGVAEIPQLQKLLRYICERASNIMSRPIFLRVSIRGGTKPYSLSGLGYVLAQLRRRSLLMAIVAGVDFGTLSVVALSWSTANAVCWPPPCRGFLLA